MASADDSPHERRVALLAQLVREAGGDPRRPRCAHCRRRVRQLARLEVDHVDGRDWQPRDFSQGERVDRYWREYRAGVALRALCRRCNAQLGAQLGRVIAAVRARLAPAAGAERLGRRLPDVRVEGDPDGRPVERSAALRVDAARWTADDEEVPF